MIHENWMYVPKAKSNQFYAKKTFSVTMHIVFFGPKKQ